MKSTVTLPIFRNKNTIIQWLLSNVSQKRLIPVPLLKIGSGVLMVVAIFRLNWSPLEEEFCIKIKGNTPTYEPTFMEFPFTNLLYNCL